MQKSADAFRTISEVAQWLDVPAHVLRFWESKFTQVKPVKRAGGRRYYRPADMELIGGIKTLLHDRGMTIKGVQKTLREEGVRHVATLSPPLDGPTDDQDRAAPPAATPEPPQAEPSAPILPFPSLAPQATPEQAPPQPAEPPAPAAPVADTPQDVPLPFDTSVLTDLPHDPSDDAPIDCAEPLIAALIAQRGHLARQNPQQLRKVVTLLEQFQARLR